MDMVCACARARVCACVWVRARVSSPCCRKVPSAVSKNAFVLTLHLTRPSTLRLCCSTACLLCTPCLNCP